MFCYKVMSFGLKNRGNLLTGYGSFVPRYDAPRDRGLCGYIIAKSKTEEGHLVNLQDFVKLKGLGLNLVQNLPWKHFRDMQKIFSSNTSEKMRMYLIWVLIQQF